MQNVKQNVCSDIIHLKLKVQANLYHIINIKQIIYTWLNILYRLKSLCHLSHEKQAFYNKLNCNIIYIYKHCFCHDTNMQYHQLLVLNSRIQNLETKFYGVWWRNCLIWITMKFLVNQILWLHSVKDESASLMNFTSGVMSMWYIFSVHYS